MNLGTIDSPPPPPPLAPPASPLQPDSKETAAAEVAAPALLRSRTGSWARECIGPMLLLAAFAYLLAWSWGRWLDPVIDFGRELYVPWQLSEGRLPQIDVITSYGPLSHLLNGLGFYLFGATLRTLVWMNVAVLGVVTGLSYAVLRAMGSALGATVGCLVFLTVCGFGHLIFNGNFNFITPYSHEATHGFAIGVAGLFCLTRLGRSPRGLGGVWAAGIGGCIGLAFLTKPEIFVAVAGALGFGGVMLIAASAGHRAVWTRTVGIAGLAALVPILGVLGWLWMHLPVGGGGGGLAFRETVGAWSSLVGNARVVGVSFYANSAGFDHPGEALAWMGREAEFFACLLGPGLVAAYGWRGVGGGKGSWLGRWMGGAVGVLLAAVMLYLCGMNMWPRAGAILLLGIVAAGGWQLVLLVRGGRKKGRGVRWRRERIVRMAVIAFAGLMMLKMILLPRFQQYGFVLGAMAAMVLATVLVDWIPGALEKDGRRGSAFRGAALVVLAALLFTHMMISTLCMAPKTYVVATAEGSLAGPGMGAGADAFLTDDRGPIIQDAVNYLAASNEPERTLTVFPEGAMLNFLSKRRSPVPYVIFTPPEFVIFDHDAMLAAIEKGRPSFIAIVHRPTGDFGPERFGFDYATDVRDWIRANYKPVHLSGAMPFSSEKFGILLLERSDLLPSAGAAASQPATP